MDNANIIKSAKSMSLDKLKKLNDGLEKLKNEINKIHIYRIYNEIISIVPDEIWTCIMRSFFSGCITILPNGNNNFIILQQVCKKWTKAIFSIEAGHIGKYMPAHFWNKFDRLAGLRLSRESMMIYPDNKFAYLKSLDLVDVRHCHIIDFSLTPNLVKLLLSYEHIAPENIQCLQKLKMLVILYCPEISVIVNAKLSMLERIILDAPNTFMSLDIINSSPKLKSIGIYRLIEKYEDQYAACFELMKHQIKLETDKEKFLKNGIAASYITLKEINPEKIQMSILSSKNWLNTQMNGMSFYKTYAEVMHPKTLGYFQYVSIRSTSFIEYECRGNCVDGHLHGHGILHKNGDVYDGMWEKNEPVGNFTVRFGNGDCYYGKINESYEISGSGTLTRADGSVLTSDRHDSGIDHLSSIG